MKGWKLRNRIYSMVEKMPNGCWNWTGNVTTDGYGQCGADRAHRVSWEVHSGRLIPDGMVIMHTCDNRRCINPHHLSPGTHAENVRDKVRKSRQARGATNGRHVLVESDVHVIRRMAAHGVSSGDIGYAFRVDESTVRAAVSGKTWKHIAKGPEEGPASENRGTAPVTAEAVR